MRRPNSWTIIVFLFLFLSFPARQVLAQHARGGVIRGGFAAKGPVQTDGNTFQVPFAVTPVGATASEDCYYNCFFTGTGQCNYSGVISLKKQVSAPFKAINFRKVIAGSNCNSGSPVSFPLSLAANEALLMDFRFSPTAPGGFSDSQIFNMAPTNSPTDDFVWLLSGSTPSAPPTIGSFTATPSTIRPGQSATLGWSVTGATSVLIDSGVGSQAATGAISVTPNTTTTYTLTALSGNLTSTAQVTVTVLSNPSLVISTLPQPILQLQGTGGGTTSYTVTNTGGAATQVTLTQSGTFFTQSPASFTLAPGGSQTITVTASAQPGGSLEGSATISGSGVSSPLQVRIAVFSTAPPASAVTAKPTERRVDVFGPPGAAPTGTVSFTNSGTATLSGILVSDVPWIIPQSGVVTIPGGTTATFSFTVDRTRRADSDIGSSSGGLSILFLSGPVSSKGGSLEATPAPSVGLVTIVDTVQLTVGGNSAPALGANEVALFVPGVGHVIGSVGKFISDVSVLNPPGSKAIGDVQFFYKPIGGAGQKSAALPPIGNSAFVLGDLVKSVFGADSQIGSLQIRSSAAAKLLVSTNIFNTTNPAGTYGTAIPTFRSDRAVPPGERLVLTGLRQGAGSHTNLFIQETSGLGVTVQTEFITANGTSAGTGRTDDIAPFSLGQFNSAVPAGAVSAILTNSSTNGGKFLAYATPVDDTSGDNWSLVDWSRQLRYTGVEPVIVPVAGVLQGANNTFFRTDMAVMNSGTTAGTGTLRFISRSGETTDRTISLGARQSSILDNVIGTLFGAANGSVGYLLFTPTSGTFAITSRTYTTVAGQPATFGTGVPTIAVSGAAKAGTLRAIGSLSDAASATVAVGTPATFRTNFGLVETSGNSAVVRVTLNYTYPAGAKTQAIGSSSKDYSLNPNQFLLLNGIAAEIIGSSRQTLGDLRGLEADFQVISGSGAVTVFTSSIDNGTGDSILRID